MRSETNGNSNKIIISILIVAIIGSWVYFNYSINSTKAELTIESDTKIATIEVLFEIVHASNIGFEL